MAFLQVFLDLGFSSVLGHFRFYCHFHVNFRIYLHLDFIILLDYFCSRQYNFTSDFSLYFLFSRKRCGHTPKLFSLLKNIPDIYKISWGNDQDLIVGKVNNFCIIVWRFYLFVILIDIGIKRFLKLKIVE